VKKNLNHKKPAGALAPAGFFVIDRECSEKPENSGLKKIRRVP